MKRVVVLISGRGSNLGALINAQHAYTIAGVVSDNPHAPGLALAAEHGIPQRALRRTDFNSLTEMKEGLLRVVQEMNPDIVALAGFMQIAAPAFVRYFESRLFNIHPSLLPKFPGLDTHERVIAAGEREHGCTVHLVDEGVDTGPIIAQARVVIPPGATPHVLAGIVLEREHKLYPWVINSVAKGEIACVGRKIEFSDVACEEAKSFGFDLSGALVDRA